MATSQKTSAPPMPLDYDRWLESVKERVSRAQTRAAVAVNRELVLLYWELGRDILSRQAKQGWGAKVIDRLATDLRIAFPALTGFSARNLKYMRAFAAAWPDDEFVQQVAAQMPWGHHQVLLDRLSNQGERAWYAQASVQHRWSRSVLVHQIDSHLIDRHGAAQTNFEVTLPPAKSELAQQLLKDPQVFDFLNLGPEFLERELEDALVTQMQRFLMELGKGFAFVARQYHLEVGGQDYYIDLLFYHLQLHCYIAIELKVDEFRPEYVGKMQFYLAALDDLVKTDLDGPSIGLILCKTKNGIVAKYALRDANKPIGVASYVTKINLKGGVGKSLPTVKQLVSMPGFAEVSVQGEAPTTRIAPPEKADAPITPKRRPRTTPAKRARKT